MQMTTEKPRRRGDRKDGWLVPETDAIHAIMPYLLPNRADNEAVLNALIDLTAVNAYLEEKNSDNPEFKYTLFHVICAAIAKTVVLRPRLNRFYAGNRLYDRKEIIFSFVVKKRFTDNSEEVLSMIKIDTDSDVPPITQIYNKIKDIVYSVRKEKKQDSTTDKINILLHLPRFLLKIVIHLLKWMDTHGWYPTALMKDDPYFSTVFLSNLGSIKMDANYHHLANWGTNSVFVTIGEKKPTPFYDTDGTCSMRDALELGLTIDERIADGLYYAKSIQVLKHLLAHPTLLDLPIATPVETLEGRE